MDGKITKDDFIKRRLSQKIGELECIIAELEFSALVLKEENEKLKKKQKEKNNIG